MDFSRILSSAAAEALQSKRIAVVGVGAAVEEQADDVVVTGLSMVSSSLTERGMYSSGLPAMETSAWRRVVARLRHLDELFDRVKRLEKGAGPRDADGA